MNRIRICAALAMIALACPASAEPPQGADLSSPIHRWFDQQRNHNGVPGELCCGEADCRPHLMRRGGDGVWWVLDDAGAPMAPAPDYADKSGDPNPFSFMGACLDHQGRVRCIWPPGET